MNTLSTTHSLAELRQTIARLERQNAPAADRRNLPFGLEEIDNHLPGGGLALGCLHEVADTGPGQEHASAAALMVAGILARISGTVIWAADRRDLFAPALAGVGLGHGRILHVAAGNRVLLAMEEGLRHPGLAGVVGEVGRLDLTASRRLQLAAEGSGVVAFALRRSRKSADPAFAAPLAAVSRWRIGSLPSAPPVPYAPKVQGLGPMRWRIDLVRCRGAEPASWIVEACDAKGRLRLATNLADRSLAPPVGKRRAG